MALTRHCRTAVVVARRDVYEQLWNPVVWFLVLVATVLTVFVTRMNVERLIIAEAQYRSLVEQREQDRQKSNGILFGSDVEPGIRAIRSPEPLSIFTAGGEGPMARFWDFSPSGVRAGRVAEPTFGARDPGGLLDLAFVIRVLVGLLAISLAVETIAGERASGALLALLGQPVKARHVLAGKLVAGTFTLGLAVGIVIVAALLTTALTQAAFVTPAVLVSSPILWLLGTLYAFVCFGAGIFISISLTIYRHALIGTFVGWTMVALVAPPGVAVIAQVLAPSQHPAVLEAERARLVEMVTNEAERRIGDEYVRVLGGAGTWTAHRDDVAMTTEAQRRVEPIWADAVTRMRAQLDDLTRASDAARGRQWSTMRVLGVPNPAVAFATGTANVAGTGHHATDRWDRALEAYQRTLQQRLFDERPNIRALAPYVNPRQPDVERRLVLLLKRHQAPTVSTIAEFDKPTTTVAQSVRDAAPQIALLAIQALLLVFGSVVTFGRLRL